MEQSVNGEKMLQTLVWLWEKTNNYLQCLIFFQARNKQTEIN